MLPVCTRMKYIVPCFSCWKWNSTNFHENLTTKINQSLTQRFFFYFCSFNAGNWIQCLHAKLHPWPFLNFHIFRQSLAQSVSCPAQAQTCDLPPLLPRCGDSRNVLSYPAKSRNRLLSKYLPKSLHIYFLKKLPRLACQSTFIWNDIYFYFLYILGYCWVLST